MIFTYQQVIGVFVNGFIAGAVFGSLIIFFLTTIKKKGKIIYLTKI